MENSNPTFCGAEFHASGFWPAYVERTDVVTFARRSVGGPRGILGVLSDDLGQTWSREFVLRGDAYTWDCGYQLLTELNDGRLFTAYYITTHDGG